MSAPPSLELSTCHSTAGALTWRAFVAQLVQETSHHEGDMVGHALNLVRCGRGPSEVECA